VAGVLADDEIAVAFRDVVPTAALGILRLLYR
jgi:hypothetical protein